MKTKAAAKIAAKNAERLLNAMRMFPDGLELQEYARMTGKSLRMTQETASLLAREGMVMFERLSECAYWTATEHRDHFGERVKEWRAMRAREKSARRSAVQCARRKQKRTGQPVQRPINARYAWPEDGAYVEPPRVIPCSVWELAEAIA